MRILIIGGTGLISTPMTNFLLQRGDDVMLYNRSSTPARIPEGTRVVQGDRKQYAGFEQQMRELGDFDCVIDMIGFVPQEAESAVRAFKDHVGQFIFCSTVDVYQKPATIRPYTEAESYGGLNDYSSNKVLSEQILLAAQEQGGFPLTIIRPAYTYGESRGLLYPFGTGATYFERLKAGKPLIVAGDGNSLWVCCHVDDCARAFVGAAGNPKTLGKSYHVTGEEWLTWNEYHQQAAQAIGAPEPKLVHIPVDMLMKFSADRARIITENFAFNNIFDNSAAKADLGFEYTIPWKEGVQRVVRWLEANGKLNEGGDDSFDDRVIETWQRIEAKVASEYAPTA